MTVSGNNGPKPSTDKIAVISDIHGNATALSAVLSDIDAQKIRQVISLGDNIGYGPEPEKVVQLIRDRKIPSVMGNHELAISNPEFLAWFNPVARTSLEKTKTLISADTIDYVSGLPNSRVIKDCRFVHGFPPESPTQYLFEMPEEKTIEALTELAERICFIGHTHELLLIGYNGAELLRQPLKRGEYPLQQNFTYIVNAGSVGQPRDGDSHAKYVIWDMAAEVLEVRYVLYDIADTVQKIYQAGLPEQHAWRLM